MNAITKSHRKRITRRALVFGGVQALALSALAGRLYYLQFIKSESYRVQAENNRIKLQLVPPARGMLTDRAGKPLALNERNWQLYIDVTGLRKEELRELLHTMDHLLPLGEKKIDEIIARARKVRFPPPILLKEHMTWDEVARAELHAMEMPGAYINTGQKRHYPLGEYGAHLLGYLGAVSEAEMDKDEPLHRLPDYKIGKNGIERMADERLRGSAGIRQLEVNAQGLAVRELKSQQSIAGETIRLTIDADIQRIAAERLGEESGAVVVMNVHNGDVLVMTSMPAFDPDVFSSAIPADYWKSLHDDDHQPLINKAVQGQYPPGSTFKLVVAMAALKSGVSPTVRVHCPGHYYLGNHRFNCWKEGGHGSVSVHEAIAGSCDTYFYTMAERLGIDAIANMARAFGLGQDDLLGFPGEKGGIIPDTKWKKARYNDIWRTGDTVNVGIGQGYILSTPLQLCVMTARLASGGYAVTPRLFADDSVPDYPLMAVDGEHLAIVQKAMDAVVNSPIGTAYGKRILKKDMGMGGKTGTSQVRRITQRGMDQSQLPWEYRHHALFVGYAPIQAPKYAISVLVEHGGGGSSAAAPIARDVLLAVQEREQG